MKRVFKYSAGIVVILLGAVGVAWTAEPPTGADMPETTITPTHEQALANYVRGRFSRIRGSVDADRAEARRYMSPEFVARYEAEFNPTRALAEFKACEDCEEFGVEVIRMQHELHDERVPWNEYATNVSYVEFATVPVTPADAEPRVMAVQLNWRPCDVLKKGDAPLEISYEDMLVRRQRVEM